MQLHTFSSLLKPPCLFPRPHSQMVNCIPLHYESRNNRKEIPQLSSCQMPIHQLLHHIPVPTDGPSEPLRQDLHICSGFLSLLCLITAILSSRLCHYLSLCWTVPSPQNMPSSIHSTESIRFLPASVSGKSILPAAQATKHGHS